MTAGVGAGVAGVGVVAVVVVVVLLVRRRRKNERRATRAMRRPSRVSVYNPTTPMGATGSQQQQQSSQYGGKMDVLVDPSFSGVHVNPVYQEEYGQDFWSADNGDSGYLDVLGVPEPQQQHLGGGDDEDAGQFTSAMLPGEADVLFGVSNPLYDADAPHDATAMYEEPMMDAGRDGTANEGYEAVDGEEEEEKEQGTVQDE